MTLKHLKFEELSDLMDNELTSEEREAFLTHISQCEECKQEYESLLKTQSLVSSLNEEDLLIPDFSKSTIVIYTKRERNRLLYKVIPAIAASVIIVIGIAFVKIGSFNKVNSYFSQNSLSHGDVQSIVEHIGNLKVQILQINNSYIDTEFDRGMLTDFENLLLKNNIKHTVITHSVAINAFEKNTEAFVGSKNALMKNFNNSSLENGKIRIRIFK